MSAVAEVVLYRHRPLVQDPPNPDAVLLAVCAKLGRRRDRWQELWEPTSPDPEGDTPADRRWWSYNSNVWPGTDQKAGGGLAGRLLKLPARTPEGLAAKAAAMAAMEDTGGYTGCSRMDSCDLAMSVARDAAGLAYRPIGEAAQ